MICARIGGGEMMRGGAYQGVEAAGLVEVVRMLHVARAQAALQVQRGIRT